MVRICAECGSPEHPEWKAHVFVNTKKPSVNTLKRLVNTVSGAVNTKPVGKKDRHVGGYMRMYMAVRRAVISGRACPWPRG